MHLGFQLVLWEVTNYPKVKMKMIWFYVLEDSRQPFSMAELQPLKFQFTKINKSKSPSDQNSNIWDSIP